MAPGRTDLPVTIDRLAAVDPDSVGLIGDNDGGLGVGMWRGSSRAQAIELVQLLPAPIDSAAMRSLARRLLLTTATAPDGKSDHGPLLLARARKLSELGAVAESVELIRAAPPGAADARLAQVAVEGLFFANDNSGACARVRGVDHQGGYWQQALAYCLALAGETEKASVIADLLRERGAETLPGFLGLIEAILGDKNARVELPAEPSALTLSMMRTAKRKLPEAVASSRTAAVLRFMALAPNADLAARLTAAERAAALGALSAGELAEIEAGVPLTPDEMPNAVAISEAQWTPRARALLLRAALAETAPAARAALLMRAFALAREKGGLATFRQVARPALDGFAPVSETLAVAGEVGATFYAFARAKEGDAWYAAVERAAPSNPDAARAWTVLWPLAQLATRPAAWDPTMVMKWRAAQGPAGREDAGRARATLVFVLFEAVGQPVPADAWTSLVNGASAGEPAPSEPAAIYALNHAVREQRRAETVALALIALGSRGPTGASPLALGAVIGALARAGLEADARALALEAAAGG
jgi:hypothetical protein